MKFRISIYYINKSMMCVFYVLFIVWLVFMDVNM